MGEAKRRRDSGAYPDIAKTNRMTSESKATGCVSWEVVGDLSSHPKSAAVVLLLEKLRLKHAEGGGNLMIVTLEAPLRTPIIRAKVEGLGAFMGLIDGMISLGLVDRLEEASGPERGVDAAFS